MHSSAAARGGALAAAAAAAAAALLCRGAAALGAVQAQGVPPGARERRGATPSDQRWGLDEQRAPEMAEAVAEARAQVSPEISPNVNDFLWYHGDYQYDRANPLEYVTLHTDQVGPSAEQLAKEKEREEEAMAVLGPRAQAEEDEANSYYKDNFTHDAGNDLEDFTASSKYYEPAPQERKEGSALKGPAARAA